MPQNLEIQKYVVLPGIAMYFAGQWIVNLNYWGCNQYITQRALGANLETARKGILFAVIYKNINACNCNVAWYCRLCTIQKWAITGF